MAFSKRERRAKIKKRIRKNIGGTAEMPRMAIFRSNKQISVQIIDDVSKKTLFAATSLNKDIAGQKVNKTEQAKLVGKMIAEKATTAGLLQVVFDRSGYLYHGRVKALAEGAREGGLKI